MILTRRSIGRTLSALCVLLCCSHCTGTQSGSQPDTGTASQSESQPVTRPHIEVQLVAEHVSILPGRPFHLALRLRMDKEWHTYWKNPGDAGLPTSIEWKLPEGFTAGEIEWPRPEIIAGEPDVSYGYSGEVLLPVEITPPASLRPGTEVKIEARAKWLVCKEACIAGNADLSLTLPISETASPARSRWADAFDLSRSHIPRTMPEWQVAARRQDEGYLLNLSGPEDRLPRVGQVQFIPAEESVIDHAAEQSFTQMHDFSTLALARSPFAAEPAERLRGLLISQNGWDADGTVHAIEIDVPVHHDSGQ